jgi:hypothetical protein
MGDVKKVDVEPRTAFGSGKTYYRATAEDSRGRRETAEASTEQLAGQLAADNLRERQNRDEKKR